MNTLTTLGLYNVWQELTTKTKLINKFVQHDRLLNNNAHTDIQQR